ncbi:MAG: hypothetical protein RMK29_13250 [Myxococcales bacterium]|nr:hypothetical protein [Myxococcota bacterium]MDW8282673.1 hypothetical protein [Myxococcales bacterium]
MPSEPPRGAGEPAAPSRPGGEAEVLEAVTTSRALRAAGDVAGAVRLIRRALAVAGDSEPSNRRLRARLEFELGQIFEEDLGRLDGALVHYQRAYKLDPDEPGVLARGRAIYRALGDVAMVGRLFELELEGARGPGLPLDLVLEFARLKLDQQRDPVGAARLLRRAMAGVPPETPLPDALLETLAEALVSPDYLPDEGEDPSVQASHLYLELAQRRVHGHPDGSISEAAREEAVRYLRRALGACPHNISAAVALERLYESLPSPAREAELLRLYRTGARVPRRALKLLTLLAGTAGESALRPEQRREAIAACRAGLEEAETVEEWQQTRGALRRLLEAEQDQVGLADLLREDAAEAALPQERAALLLQAADMYRRAGALPRYVETLEQVLSEDPLHQEAFRRLCEYHSGRRDLASLARAHEMRLEALLRAEEIAPRAHLQLLEELADLYERKLGDLAAAVDAWRRIDETFPSARSQAELRRLGQRLSRVQLQVAELQAELDRTPASATGTRVELLRRLAQLHREQHEHERAVALYEELLLFAPGDGPALRALCDLRELLGDVPGQIDALRRMAGAATGRAERLSLLRRLVALCTGRPDAAEPLAWACGALLRELPSDREALRRLIEALEILGDPTGQLEAVESALKVAPTPQEKLPLHQRAARLCEEIGDLDRAVQHLEKAARLCPPGPDQEAILLALAQVLGAAGRPKEQLQVLEAATKNARASEEAFRRLGRAMMAEPRDRSLEERALRAWGEVLRRRPGDLEALEAMARLQRARGEFRELAATLRRLLQVPDQSPEWRLSWALQLADVVAQRLDDKEGAVAVLEQVQSESPMCDRKLHHRLRVLHEELGHFAQAARYAERELLLTEDPLDRMEVAMQIAALWRYRAGDAGRALLSYQRVVEMLPPASEDSLLYQEASRLVAQALDAQSELHAEAGRWDEVVGLLDERLRMTSGEPMRAALILLEVAVVCEEKQGDLRRGFELRRRAYELAPEVAPLTQLTEVAERGGLWAELCQVHIARVEGARAQGRRPPRDAILAAAELLEQRLADRKGAFQLLRGGLPSGAEGAVELTTPGSDGQVLLEALLVLLGKLARDGSPEVQPLSRELLHVLHGLVDDLCSRRGAGSEEMAVVLHRLLGTCARLREQVLGDLRGALDERLRAFQLGGERDRGLSEEATAAFRETLAEIRRLALATGQIKEALQVDQRRLDRAEGEQARREVAAETAIWLDDHGGDPPRAMRACLKALALCEEGSELQAELRRRLFSLGKRLGNLAWEEIARAERNVPAGDTRLLQRRLLHVAALWEQGAGEVLRAIEAVGQAYRATFFPPPDDPALRQELLAERPGLRHELDRLAQKAPTDSEGPARVVALLDSIASALSEAGEGHTAIQVLLDAARCDEKRGRLAHAERRYQEVLRADPANDEALAQLERLYRQGRRWNDLVGLLERRRSGSKERLPKGPARRAMFLELGELYQQLGKSFEALDVYASMAAEDDDDPEPYHRMARLHEMQRAYARAAEAWQKAADRAIATSPARALHALLRCGEVWEKHVGSPERALAAYQAALQHASSAEQETEGDEAGALAVDADVRLVLAGAERILERLGRLAELEALLARRGQELCARGAEAERVDLLRRRLRLLRERLPRDESNRARTLACLEELADLLPDDDEILQQLGQLAADAGERGRMRQLMQRRAEAAERRGEPAKRQAELWTQAARLALQENALAEAEACLDRALQLHPHDEESLATLAELRRQQGDLAGHVQALEELAAHGSDANRVAQALLQAAQVRYRELSDAGAARALLERLMEHLPASEAWPSEVGAQAVALLADLALAAGDEEAAARYARQELSLGCAGPARAAELHTRIGQIESRRQNIAEAESHLRAALATQPGRLDATRALVDLLTQDLRDDAAAQSEALLRQALEVPPEPLADGDRASLLRQLADAQAALGRTAEALACLLRAEELAPGGPQEHLTLGELAFSLGQHEVAARHLGALASSGDHRDALPSQVLAMALTHAARSCAVLGRDAGEIRALLDEALRRAPDHEEAEAELLHLLLADGAPAAAAEEALGLLTRQAARRAADGDRVAAAERYRQAARVALVRLGDRRRARQILDSAAASLAAGDEDRSLRAELKEALLELARDSGELDEARRCAEELVELAPDGATRARRRQQLADLLLEMGERDQALAQLRAALADTPTHLPLLVRLARLLPDHEAVALLEERLPRLGPEAPAEEQAEAWALLGTLQGRCGNGRAAAAAYDRAVLAATGLGAERVRALRREALATADLADPEAAARHLAALRVESPLDRDLLEILARLQAQQGHLGAAWRARQVLAAVHGAPPPKEPPSPVATGATLEEEEHACLGDSPARVLAEVLATLWEGVVAARAPGPDALGVGQPDRLPPSESSPDVVVRGFALACRVLNNRKALLYRSSQPGPVVPQICAHPPTALVVAPGLWELPPAGALFLLGRSVELLRPEYILAEALSREELARLLGLALRAFHPRHVRHANEAVAAWRRDLPYRTVKRLSDLFREHPDVQFSTGAWRRAVRRAANRAGLLVCGDLCAARAMLEQMGGEETSADVEDLALFWLSDQGGKMAERLRPP